MSCRCAWEWQITHRKYTVGLHEWLHAAGSKSRNNRVLELRHRKQVIYSRGRGPREAVANIRLEDAGRYRGGSQMQDKELARC